MQEHYMEKSINFARRNDTVVSDKKALKVRDAEAIAAA